MPNESTKFARTLRHNQTDTERELWHLLRGRELAGCKFRRQVPLGPYVADFVCLSTRLIVELDGGQHGEQITYDSERTKRLETQDFRVLRFWNNQVFEEREAVLATILSALTAPSPSPSPARGEGTERRDTKKNCAPKKAHGLKALCVRMKLVAILVSTRWL